ncbi:hypothetical protein NG798_15705 [Ancylothrix sp. C2]|uniref:hypothetical protein n=1 Tax=Ancylothrix sp. D3o TaxID=2953691 RepID=UPI0021BB74C3|nr:hypothetical protein [Ancylothrix sp. D3o]MCT7951245.1 hypothetical protein [Ancylothrix sp. D3o]
MLGIASLFNETYYLAANPDVAAAVRSGNFLSGFDHYILNGQLEARKPSGFFDESFYLATNADVAIAVRNGVFVNGLAHFIERGQFEGRNPISFFDTNYYLTQNTDVKNAVGIDSLTGIQHFIENGQFEGRNPSADFDNSYYLSANPDVAAAVRGGIFKSGFEHYVNFGMAENRMGKPSSVNIYVSNNGPTNVGEIDKLTGTFGGQKRFFAGNNEGVEFDNVGNLYQAGDVIVGAGSIRIISKIGNRLDGEAFAPNRDREIAGPLTGLNAPKGFAIAQTRGFIIVADNGAGDLKVFGTSAGGNIPPVAVTNLPAKPWDVAYDEANDRLYAALVDGTVSVFDNYFGNINNFGTATISRSLTIVNSLGAKISTNLHGIVYEPTRNQLVVTDVGAATAAQSATFNTDGRIYVLDNVSSANGAVVPSRTIEGPATQMGNPVDLILNGTDALVAEKAKDQLLIFRNIFNGPSGNIAPDLSVAETKPEALAAERMQALMYPDVTDVESATIPISSIATTSNPPATGATDFVARLSTNLQQQTAFNTSNAVASLENITYDLTGDAFITFDNGNDTNGGILIVNRLAESRNNGGFNASRDRIIAGANTGLVSPKGLEVADGAGVVFVAENNATTPAIIVFNTQAQGDVAPLFKTTNLAGRRPWDVDYSPSKDQLFVAATDGTVLVYDSYLATLGANGPTRIITPFDPSGVNKISVNLHGIIYVESSDTLLISDVGSAQSATDGQLFVINNAGAANGNTAVRAQIVGSNTFLGNPVDITFDGNNLYVAEKSNNAIFRFDNIQNQSGVLNINPNLGVTRNRPESVALAPAYLSDTLA